MCAEGDGKAAPGRSDGGAARQLAAADRANDERIQAADDVAEVDAEFVRVAEGCVLAAEHRAPLLPPEAVRPRRHRLVAKSDRRGGCWREGGDERAVEGQRSLRDRDSGG